MVDDIDLARLRNQRIPVPDPAARAKAFNASAAAFEAERNRPEPKASAARPRLIERAWKLWSEAMQRKMMQRRRLPAS
jgi:Ca-activated chloride channel homolog